MYTLNLAQLDNYRRSNISQIYTSYLFQKLSRQVKKSYTQFSRLSEYTFENLKRRQVFVSPRKAILHKVYMLN